MPSWGVSVVILATIIGFVNGKPQDKVHAGHGGKYLQHFVRVADHLREYRYLLRLHRWEFARWCWERMNEVNKDRAVAKALQSRPLGTRVSLLNWQYLLYLLFQLLHEHTEYAAACFFWTDCSHSSIARSAGLQNCARPKHAHTYPRSKTTTASTIALRPSVTKRSTPPCPYARGLLTVPNRAPILVIERVMCHSIVPFNRCWGYCARSFAYWGHLNPSQAASVNHPLLSTRPNASSP